MRKLPYTSFELLAAWLDWWDEWKSSSDPAAVDDPAVEETRHLLAIVKSADSDYVVD